MQLSQFLHNSRLRSLAISSFSTSIASISNIAISFITVPLLLGYLGSERYGLWITVTSLVIIMMNITDGGISNGLITGVAKAEIRGGQKEVRKLIGSAFVILIPVGILLVTLTLIITPLIPWDRLLNLDTESLVKEAQQTIFIITTCLSLGIMSNIVFKTRMGLQQIPVVSAWNTLATLSVLPVLLLVIHLELSMAWLVLAMFGTLILVKSIASLQFLAFTPNLIPKRSDINFNSTRDLFGGGIVIFIITVSQAIAIQSDQILIANLVSVEDVATYSVVQRLFTIPYVIANFIFLALWPTISSAAERGEYVWIKKAFIRILFFTGFASVILSCLLFLFSDQVFHLWVGGQIIPDTLLVAIFAIYAVLMVIVGCCSTLLIALDVRKPQIWINLSMVLVNLPLSLYLIPKLGGAGAIIGTTVSYLACMIIPYAIIIPSIINKKIMQVN